MNIVHQQVTVDPSLLVELRALEVALHQPIARRDGVRLNALLHHDFEEIGRSGRKYTRVEVVASLVAESSVVQDPIESDGYNLSILGPDVALLTYHSALRLGDGGQVQETLRSSVWVRDGGVWKLRFHQGTPKADTTPSSERPHPLDAANPM